MYFVANDYGDTQITGCYIADPTNLRFNRGTSTLACDWAAGKYCIQKNPEYDETKYVNKAECEAYGLSMGDSDGLTSLTNNYPVGCFRRTSGYFWSSGTDGTLCTTTNACIQKQIPNADYVSAEECEQYASQTSAGWIPATSNSNMPHGCYLDPTYNNIYFNTQTTTGIVCSSTQPCIKKNLKRDLRYVSQEDCKAYGESIGKWDTANSVVSWSLVPKGCFVCGSSHCTGVYENLVQYNTASHEIPCGNRAGDNCIQKVPNKGLQITATGYGITYKGYDPYHCTHSANVRSQLDLSSYDIFTCCLLYTSPSPRDRTRSRMPSSA